MKSIPRIALIIGSGPNALKSASWPKAQFAHIVVINNAWRIRSDWTHFIHPEDFPNDRHPPNISKTQHVVTAADYVDAQNTLGGFIYAGGTMAFTAGYWALATLKPNIMAFIGCDMVYPTRGATHFYGTGAADPLRDDVTLQSLEAKSARLLLHAESKGCRCINLSTQDSRLCFPRLDPSELATFVPHVRPQSVKYSMAAPLAQEAALNYFFPSGRYWEIEDQLNPDRLAEIDQLWLAAFHATKGALK